MTTAVKRNYFGGCDRCRCISQGATNENDIDSFFQRLVINMEIGWLMLQIQTLINEQLERLI